MNEDIVKGKWKELRGKVRERWGKVTGDDVDRLKGTSDELIGLLQQRYGYEREQARKEIQEWGEALLVNKRSNIYMTNGNSRVLSASSLKKDKVKNLAGETLGDIEDLVIDLETGRIAYSVLKFGGKFGLGNKLFAIPWQALTLDQEKHEFLLDVKKETLQNAPGFDKDKWPDMSDHRWGAGIHTHYGVTPYWQKPM